MFSGQKALQLQLSKLQTTSEEGIMAVCKSSSEVFFQASLPASTFVLHASIVA